jgi:hypothetical protein
MLAASYRRVVFIALGKHERPARTSELTVNGVSFPKAG